MSEPTTDGFPTGGDPVPPASVPAPATPPTFAAETTPPDDTPRAPDAAASMVYGTDPAKLVPIGVRCKLDRRIIKGWYWSGLLGTVSIAVGGFCAEHFWLEDESWWPFPHLWGTGIAATLTLVLGLASPVWAWRNWSYVIREHDVLMDFGILWKTSRSVPRLRIQHVDVKIDPIDRLLGLASVTLYTAGSSAEDAEIPGLRPEVAEAIREELLITKEQAEQILEEVAGPTDAAAESAPDVPGPLEPDALGAPDPRSDDPRSDV